jgi:CRP/FNR family transcriptional regulator
VLSRDRHSAVTRAFPFLQQADAALDREFRSAATWARLPAGRQLFLEGECAMGLPLLMAGTVRIYKVGNTGREITLYRFGAGEACILSADAILNDRPLAAAAVVEERGEAVLVPADAFRHWVHTRELWRRFVFELMSHRLTEVLGIVDSVVFRRMDARVAGLLLVRSVAQEPLRITHQEIADELGTSREVVSRILETLATNGVLRAARGRITILDRESLAESASG